MASDGRLALPDPTESRQSLQQPSVGNMEIALVSTHCLGLKNPVAQKDPVGHDGQVAANQSLHCWLAL